MALDDVKLKVILLKGIFISLYTVVLEISVAKVKNGVNFAWLPVPFEICRLYPVKVAVRFIWLQNQQPYF